MIIAEKPKEKVKESPKVEVEIVDLTEPETQEADAEEEEIEEVEVEYIDPMQYASQIYSFVLENHHFDGNMIEGDLS